MLVSKAGVPLTDYKRIGGSAVGGSIGCYLLRLFSTDRFDPTARPSDQISQSKITSDRRTKVWHGRLPPITSIYYFPPMQVLPLPNFSPDFPSDHPILRSVGQWDAGHTWSMKHSTSFTRGSILGICIDLDKSNWFY